MLIDALLFLGAPGLLLFLLAGVIIPVWLIRLLSARRWKRAAILSGVVVATLLVLMGMAALDRERKRTQYLTGLFATEVTLPPPLFDHDPPREWLGDGFSLTVYELPEAIRQRFLGADARLLTSHPRPHGITRGWTIRTWTTGPLDEYMTKAMSFLLSAPEVDEGEEMQRHISTIRRRVGTPGTYHACFAEEHGTQFTNVDWFIVDLDAGRLYFINFNT